MDNEKIDFIYDIFSDPLKYTDCADPFPIYQDNPISYCDLNQGTDVISKPYDGQLPIQRIFSEFEPKVAKIGLKYDQTNDLTHTGKQHYTPIQDSITKTLENNLYSITTKNGNTFEDTLTTFQQIDKILDIKFDDLYEKPTNNSTIQKIESVQRYYDDLHYQEPPI